MPNNPLNPSGGGLHINGVEKYGLIIGGTLVVGVVGATLLIKHGAGAATTGATTATDTVPQQPTTPPQAPIITPVPTPAPYLPVRVGAPGTPLTPTSPAPYLPVRVGPPGSVPAPAPARIITEPGNPSLPVILKAPAPTPTPAPTRIYAVSSGDSLFKIAQRFYGNGNLWPRIYDANRGSIKSPSLIYPGQKLVIP